MSYFSLNAIAPISLSLSLPYPILSPVLDLTAPSSVPLSPRSQSRGYPGQGVRICPGHVKLDGMCRSCRGMLIVVNQAKQTLEGPSGMQASCSVKSLSLSHCQAISPV